MKLTDAFKIDTAEEIILVGTPEITNILTSDEEPYYMCSLSKARKITCSVDPNITPFEDDIVHVRASALAEEGWEFVDPKKPALGFYRKGWKIDYSKNQQIAVYQATTISKWARDNRGERTETRRRSINDAIKAKYGSK